MSGRINISESVEKLVSDKDKNEEIKKQIINESYFPLALDIFLILKFYNIPAIILSKKKQGTVLNSKINKFNTEKNSKEYYVITVNRKKKIGGSITGTEIQLFKRK